VFMGPRVRGDDAERERMHAPAQGRDDGLRILSCYGSAIRPRENRFE
jgi:hypothetical protein